MQVWVLLLCSALAAAAGCATSARDAAKTLKGPGFVGWSDELGGGLRGHKEAKPSGFFTDRKSEQIEQDLGGGF
jgi:hypothetical protein